MPVNMPTHGHGQGYADINFMIPELIQSVNVRQGSVLRDCRRLRLRRLPPIDYINRLTQNILETTNWDIRLSPWAGGGVDGGGCRHVARGGRGVKYNGPWDVADNVRKINGVPALQPGHRHRRLHAIGDGLFQRLEFDRSGGAGARSTRA
jgi:hypothetical protein